MISMELQREVPQYMAIPWLMTWVMARTVSAGREGESGRRGLAGAALAEGGSHRADGWRASHCPMLRWELGGVQGMLSEEQDGDRGSSHSGCATDHSRPDMLTRCQALPCMESSLRLLPVAPCPVELPALALLQGEGLMHYPHRETHRGKPEPCVSHSGVLGGASPEPCRLGPSQGVLLQPKAGSGEGKGHKAHPASTGAHTPACS